MISTVFDLADATRAAIFNETIRGMAQYIVEEHHSLDEQEMAESLYNYTTFFSAVLVDLVSQVLLTEDQVQSMMYAINEIEGLSSILEDSNEG